MARHRMITAYEKPPKGWHAVEMRFDEEEIRARREGVTRDEMIVLRDRWIEHAEGGAIFQGVYTRNVIRFHFEHLASAIAFKLRWA